MLRTSLFKNIFILGSAAYLSSRTIYSCPKLEQYKIYTGKEVNKEGKKYVKTFKRNLIHNNFIFQENTTNIDHLPFNPNGKCSPGGIYFCEENKISEWIYYTPEPNQLYAEIQLPDDAEIYNEGDKLKANKIYIGEIKEIPDEEYIKAININIKNEYYHIVEKIFCCIKNQTPEICEQVAKHYGSILFYVKNQTPNICLTAVKHNGCSIKYVKHQTPDICLEAVKQNGCSIKYIKHQTPELCLIAVQQDGWALKYVNEQTPELCLATVKKDGLLLKHVKEQTPKICLAAVEQNGLALEYVENQTLEICNAALKQNNFALKYVKNKILKAWLCFIFNL